jgi:hypothetical protein
MNSDFFTIHLSFTMLSVRFTICKSIRNLLSVTFGARLTTQSMLVSCDSSTYAIISSLFKKQKPEGQGRAGYAELIPNISCKPNLTSQKPNTCNVSFYCFYV